MAPQMLEISETRVGYDDPVKKRRSEVPKPVVAGETQKMIGTFPVGNP